MSALKKEEIEMLQKRITWLFLSVVAFVFVMGLNKFTYGAERVKEPEPYNPPTWSMQLDSTNGDAVSGCGSTRFECVFPTLSNPNGEAVLDRETGLLWEQSPGTTARTWSSALSYCFAKKVGGCKGWRLPTIEELATLVDDRQSNPALPSGHPFSNVQSSWYWSATTEALPPAHGSWALNVGYVNGSLKDDDTFFVWCVRGGQGHDAY